MSTCVKYRFSKNYSEFDYKRDARIADLVNKRPYSYHGAYEAAAASRMKKYEAREGLRPWLGVYREKQEEQKYRKMQEREERIAAEARLKKQRDWLRERQKLEQERLERYHQSLQLSFYFEDFL